MSSYLGVCPKCKDDNIILSKPRGFEFVLLRILPISVCRCQNCHHRFKKMSKVTTYVGNLVYLAIFCLIGYVLFSQYKLNKGQDYLTNPNLSSVKPGEIAEVKQKEIAASVSDAISLEEQLLNPNAQAVKSVNTVNTNNSAQTQVSKAFEKKPMPVAKVNEKRDKLEQQVRLTKLEATPATDVQVEKTAVFKSSKPITESSSTKKEDEVLLALASWRSAWQDQDVARYLASYSRKMTPKGATFSQWAAKRKQRITKPKWIRVEINSPQVQILPAKAGMPQARVVFQQIYRASNFSDTSQKELLFRKAGGNWNIVKETSL